MNSHETFVINKFKEVAKLIPAKSKILDIGCNDGKLRDFLIDCEYYGLDLNKEIINLTENCLGKERLLWLVMGAIGFSFFPLNTKHPLQKSVENSFQENSLLTEE